MKLLVLRASGTYAQTVPEELRQALVEKVIKHMEAYGFKSVRVYVGHGPDFPEEPEP